MAERQRDVYKVFSQMVLYSAIMALLNYVFYDIDVNVLSQWNLMVP
jgi:hypothetical protein